MLHHPRAGAGAVVAGQVVGDHHDGPGGVGGLDRGQQLLVAGRVAGGCGHRHRLPVADAERAVHPGLLRPTAVVQQRLDAVAVQRPAGGGWEPRPSSNSALTRWPSSVQPGAGGKLRGITAPELVGADHGRLRRRGGVAGDDLRSFGTNSGSVLCVHERGCRQRAPSASRIRRTWLRPTRMPSAWAAPVSVSRAPAPGAERGSPAPHRPAAAGRAARCRPAG